MITVLVIALFYIFPSISGKNEEINVGTVLFTSSDSSKKCWTTESVSLLTSRMIFEDVLPSADNLQLCDDNFVSDVIEYFRLSLDSVRKESNGNSKHIMLMALSDVLGGYLHHLVLPIAKYAYYAGHINYESVQKLYQLLDELKCFLKTTGIGWSPPNKTAGKNIQAKPIPLGSSSPKTNPCLGLIFYRKPCSSSNASRKKRSNCEVMIPMPYFDSKTSPTSIAIPFKTFSLRNIESKSAAYVLMKFYVAATKCLVSQNAGSRSMQKFNSNFNSFLNKQVLPHLSEDKFYSAFGGVYRIVMTLKSKGEGQEMGGRKDFVNSQEQAAGAEGIFAGTGAGNLGGPVDSDETDHLLNNAETTNEPNDVVGAASGEGDKPKRSNLILMALLTTLFIWFLLGSMFICYRIRASKDKGKGYDSRPNNSRDTFKCSKLSVKLSSKLCGKQSAPDQKSTLSSCSNPTCRSGSAPSGSSTTSMQDVNGGEERSALATDSRIVIRRRSAKLSADELLGLGIFKSDASSEKFEEVQSCVCSDSSLKDTEDGSRQEESSDKSIVDTSKQAYIMTRMDQNTAMEQCTGGGDSKVAFTGDAYSGDQEYGVDDMHHHSKMMFASKEQVSSDTDGRFEDRREMFYPATYACHSSMTGKYKMGTSSEDFLRAGQDKRSVVFGYDFETSSSESREGSDTENYMGGNLSK